MLKSLLNKSQSMYSVPCLPVPGMHQTPLMVIWPSKHTCPYCMPGWQAGLLVLVQSVLQHMHVLLLANTAANNLQTHHPLVQDHRSWQAECTAGWQAGLLVLVQSVLQHMHVLLLANTAANNLQYRSTELVTIELQP